MAIGASGMITVAEAAKRLHLSQEQVRRNLRDTKLRGQREGNQWFVDEMAVRRKVEGWTTLVDPKLLESIKERRRELANREPLPLPDEPRFKGLILDLGEQEAVLWGHRFACTRRRAPGTGLLTKKA